MKVTSFFKRVFTLRLLLGFVIGGLLGFAWYYFVGCNSSGCAITSSPYRMTGFGMLFGALLLSK